MGKAKVTVFWASMRDIIQCDQSYVSTSPVTWQVSGIPFTGPHLTFSLVPCNLLSTSHVLKKMQLYPYYM